MPKRRTVKAFKGSFDGPGIFKYPDLPGNPSTKKQRIGVALNEFLVSNCQPHEKYENLYNCKASQVLPDLVPAQPLTRFGDISTTDYNMHLFNMTHMTGPPLQTKPMPVSSEKVYPPDQPMILNPENPNAPLIHPCGTCRKEVYDGDQAILCESGCNFWFHAVCTGLSEVAFHLLREEVYAEWVCNKCLSSKDIPFVKLKA